MNEQMVGGACGTGGFREAGEALQERVPGTRAIEIADSDHFFPLLKPARTAAALHQWFVSQDAAN